LFFQRTV